MKSPLLAVALSGIFLNVFLLRRLIAMTFAGVSVPQAIRPRPASLDPDPGFVRRLVSPAAPIIVPSLASFPLFWFAQTYEEIVLGLLLIALVIALSAPLLGPELLVWGHRAHRLAPGPEADLVARLYRMGIRVDEVWVSETPIVAFWQPSLHVPAMIAGSRVLIWHHLLELSPEHLSGIALERRFVVWPWTLWPVLSALAIRSVDSASILPWWLFAVPTLLILAAGVPDAFRYLTIRRSLQTDAAASEAILGLLEIDLLGAAFIAARGSGLYHRYVSRSVWTTAVRRARAAAGLARVPKQEIDHALAGLVARPVPDYQ